MKTLKMIADYAREKGMNERDIERLISEIDGNMTDEEFENICFGIDCEAETI